MKAFSTNDTDHYKTLALSSPIHGHNLSSQDLKSAYHRALLRHHPDKLRPPPPSTSSSSNLTNTAKITIHDITTAYQTLSNPTTRAEYDRLLRLQPSKPVPRSGDSQAVETFRTGLETIDLDDLEYDELDDVWYRSCRCGDGRGFVVTEQNLEAEAKQGELIIGCRGCSLWLNVLFQASDVEQV